MIRSIQQVNCCLLGMLFIVALEAFHDGWALVILIVLIPWDIVILFGSDVIEHYISERNFKKVIK